MAEKIKLEAKARTKKANQTRSEGLIPAVLYGQGLTPKNVAVETLAFERVYREAGATSLVTLTVEGATYPTIIRDIQLHPLKNVVQHADFYQVRMDEEIKAKVPLNFVGESTAVKEAGGVLVRNMDEIEVEALPQDLPHDIEVDISSLSDFEKAIHVSDLTLPAGVKVLEEAEAVIALVQPPRSEAELEQLDEAVTEDVEAVEGVKEEEKPAEGEAAAEGAEAAPEAKAEEKKE